MNFRQSQKICLTIGSTIFKFNFLFQSIFVSNAKMRPTGKIISIYLNKIKKRKLASEKLSYLRAKEIWKEIFNEEKGNS